MLSSIFGELIYKNARTQNTYCSSKGNFETTRSASHTKTHEIYEKENACWSHVYVCTQIGHENNRKMTTHFMGPHLRLFFRLTTIMESTMDGSTPIRMSFILVCDLRASTFSQKSFSGFAPRRHSFAQGPLLFVNSSLMTLTSL